MNQVLLLTHNNLELTKHCIASVHKQDVPVHTYVIDNDSTDGTRDWLDESVARDEIFDWDGFTPQIGVSAGWNDGLKRWFSFNHKGRVEHVLCVNNDTILPPWFYSELLAYDKAFVTGVSVNQMEQIASRPLLMSLQPHPDFSAFLIRRECWEKVGPFDERMKHYASDLDYHVRAHRAGVNLWQANLPFYHERSSTLKNASPEERAQIERQADADRAVFRSIYGCGPNDPEYAELFK
jgi:GT2 family glycosyltransferase